MIGTCDSFPANPLRVGSALPDPPFELTGPSGPEGFDIALTQAIAVQLGRAWQLVRYAGPDFNGVFDRLGAGDFDCVASGATITPERALKADFCSPYLVSGQSLVIDVQRHPDVRSVADLKGLVVGVQNGNTSEPVVRRLVAERKAGSMRVYAYDEIGKALDDLVAGGCDAFMKLAPVTHWLVRDRPGLAVVQTGITREEIAISVRRGDEDLRQAIEAAQERLRADGRLQRLAAQWLGPSGVEIPGNARQTV